MDSDGGVECWGDENLSRIDQGQAEAPTGNFTQVAAGRYHTCAVAADGTITC